jgi:L-alanine-DL-glutamate epimerase-like enolase superfamily enzyme
MRITDVRTYMLSYICRPLMSGIEHSDRRNLLLVEIETDSGITGIGESASHGGPLISTKTIVDRELKPYLIGEDPLCIERLWDKMYRRSFFHGRRGIVISAMSGIDVALWDILGKASKLPLYRLLGGYREKVRAYASMGYYQTDKGLEELSSEAAQCVNRGFSAVKIKIGRNSYAAVGTSEPSVYERSDLCVDDNDIERVAAVRTAIGHDVDLLVDANCAWKPHVAIRMARKLEQFDIYWLEEPVVPDDVEGSAMVAAAIDIPIAGYETEYTRFGYKELVSRRAVDIVQPDVIWTGGITESKRIAALASCYNIQCVPETFASAIALYANLHFIASIPNGELLEFDQTPNPLRDELVVEPLCIDKEGYVHLPEKPGLGLELDWDVVRLYQLDDEGRSGQNQASTERELNR